jgi:uncharacterized protein with NRDE domain
MCTLHLFHRVFPDAPVLFAANRDEDLRRPWRPPARLIKEPWIYGPRDLTAGGTWLGVNRAGVLVSLANHLGTLRQGSPSLCSRGTVVMEALHHGSAREAVEYAAGAAPVCKAYTLLVADPERAYVVDHGDGGTRTHRLRPGCHVITNARFRDPGDPKARRCLERMAPLAEAGTPDHAELFGFLADHQAATDATTPLCIHPREGSRFGTSSASVVSITPERRVDRFWFASGPPCSATPQDRTPTLSE